jgi:hypothetical protein
MSVFLTVVVDVLLLSTVVYGITSIVREWTR